MNLDLEVLRQREFPWAHEGETIFLNHASTGPLPQSAVKALEHWGWLRENPGRLSETQQFDTLRHSRELAARLIGASVEEIALATNTSYGINLAAFMLPLGPGDVVLTPDFEFPANVYPWMAAAARRGFEYRRIPAYEGVVRTEAVLGALDDPRVKVLSVSWVAFATGVRLDLAALSKACRSRGVYFVVDAIQGLGPYRLNVQTLGVDVLACGAQKWLLSPWGSGFVYVRRDLVSRLEPYDVSWMDVVDSDDFSRLVAYNMTWRSDARRYEFITLPFQDFAGMNASLELLLTFNPSEVAAHVTALADLVVDWASQEKRVRLVTPAEREERAGIISLRPPDPAAASKRLKKNQVVHSLREGAIRLSPHVYNTEDEIRRALELIL